MAGFRERAVDSAGGFKVLATNDYQLRRRTEAGASTALALPASNVLSWELEGGSRITARPSGTEPKIKFYFELRETMKSGEPIRDARARAVKNLNALEHDFLAQAYARGLPEGN
jgi:phosphomannomutase